MINKVRIIARDIATIKKLNKNKNSSKRNKKRSKEGRKWYR